MDIEPGRTLSLGWVRRANRVALVFDANTWTIFETVARTREQSPDHMVLRSAVGCLGTIVEDNMVLNRILPPPD
jgi:hypothetical protein